MNLYTDLSMMSKSTGGPTGEKYVYTSVPILRLKFKSQVTVNICWINLTIYKNSSS